ncbi:MAG: C1 family peptidase [Nitrospirae bacterium]|nr:C1 family peptidase [Nitrospirota bacterium]
MLIKKVEVKGKLRHLSGFKKQEADPRDFLFRSSPELTGASVVTSANLLQNNLPIVDQGELGSCTANALAGLVGINEVTSWKKVQQVRTNPVPTVVSMVILSPDGKTLEVISTIKNFIVPVPTPAPAPAPTPTPSSPILASRLYEYYNARFIEGTVSEDSGATIRDTIKAAAQYGVAHESLWPYNIAQFAVKPPQSVYSEAAMHLIASYHSINDGDLSSIKAAIISGFGVEFGFNVYSSFLSDAVANTGIVPLPNVSAEALEGGHAVVIVGFDDATQNFLVRNSWGIDWGLLQTGTSAPIFNSSRLTAPGYFLMPYSYVGNLSLASDFWVVVSNVLNS